MSSSPLQSARSSASSHQNLIHMLLLCLQLVMTGVFLFGGATKLAGIPSMVTLFELIGVGQWLRYVIGSLEVLGGLVLVVPRFAGIAALGLMVLMIGAIMTEIVITRRIPIMAFGSLLALMVIAWCYRVETRHLITPTRRAHSSVVTHR